MIEVVSSETGVQAVDAAKTSIEVVADDWQPTDGRPSFPRPTDAVVSGRASALRFPPVFLVAERLDGKATYELGSAVGPIELPPGEYIVRVDANVLTYVRFSGPATIEKPNYERAVLSFPERIPVGLGFRSRVLSPPETLVVPRTPAGVATALTYFPAGHRTSTPDRSFPTMRGHPPLVEFGDAVDVPDLVAERREETGIELVLPPSFEYLFPAASLSHYLGAAVRVEEGATPTLRAPDAAVEFEPQPTFQRQTASLLRRTFLLDCLVRNAGPHGTDMEELRHIEALGLDADALYDRGVATRLAAYIDAPFDDVSDELPPWHLSMYVEPRAEQVTTLPYLLHNVPHFFLAEAEPLTRDERLSRSLDDFYRRQRHNTVSVELLKPKLGPGRVHGWLADGAPIDVFKAVPSAYRNRFKYHRRANEPISVVAVLNDSDMADEHAEAADIYRQRATDLDIDIAVREYLTTDELAEVFETPHDLVHYIGHCEESGLRCADGHLSIADIEESNAQTFFLNACGSFNEGVDLVKQGSVAGAVTFNKVLDSDAARVGTAFARLLVHGFCIERAIQLARRRIIMGKDYAVVGDGTHVLAQSDNFVSPDAHLERRSDDRFRMRFSVHSPWVNGGHYQSHLQSDRTSHLYGSELEFDLDADELRSFLSHADMPIVYDGDIHWSNDLKRTLK
ncbi:hypothetical protein [Halegenticoccus soli]|uniref:hypothetical protein n=1 Tax=Halegenticoccus soli TaxID=1985678 RepID=UPI000C6ECAC2|nr:hypothetical protein [Halegenticoccus soli]